MSARFLLIDGYNLLHAAGMARANYGPGDLQRCRTRLVRYLLHKLTPAEIARATVVFDARDPPVGVPSRLTVAGLKIAFANPGGDADALIQELLAEHSAPKRVLLVSSDHQLQRAARRARSEFVDSEDFFSLLERRRRKRPEEIDEGGRPDPKFEGLSAAETAHWESLFGPIPVEDLAESAGSDIIPAAGNSTGPPPVGVPPAKAKSAPNSKRRAAAPKDSGTGNTLGDRPEKLTQSEVEYWLQEFKEIAEADESSPTCGMSLKDLENWYEDLKRRERKSGR